MSAKPLPTTFCRLGRDIVRQRFTQMRDNRAAVRADTDPEALHDMRVAARRLRVVLDTFASCFPQKPTRRLKRQAKRLGRELGRVRDSDVLLEQLRADQEQAPPEQRAGIAWLIEQRQAERDTRFQRLQRLLRKSKAANMRADFRAIMAARDTAQSPLQTAGMVAGLLQPVLLARLAELGEWSHFLHDPTRAEEQHRLRIAAKRLRYTLELLLVIAAPAPVEESIAALRGLQDTLGTLHDADVLLGILRDALEAPSGGPEATNRRPTQEERAALQRFLAATMQEREARYRAAQDSWQQMEEQHIQERLGDLLRRLSPTPSPEEQRLCGGLGVEDWPHARQVAALAADLFRATQPLHQLDERAGALLERAALLHNTGVLIATKRHHKHSFALIRVAPLADVSDAERHEIACIARYHRRALPRPRHPEFAQLDEAARQRVSQLAALLRIADALDERHDGRVERVDAEITPECVCFSVATEGNREADAERAFARQKADLFERVFARPARFV